MTLIDKLKGAVGEAKVAVGGNADKINSVIDTVTSKADARTGGRYSDRITKLKDTAKGGVSSLASDGAAGDGVTPEPEVADAEVVEG